MYRVLSRLVAVWTVVLLCAGGAALLNRAELQGDLAVAPSNNLVLSAQVPHAGDRIAAEASQDQNDSLPNPGFTFERGKTAFVVTDPQNDFLNPKGVAWGLVGKSVRDNDTIGNLIRLFRAAKDAGLPVFISPHYYYPCDHKWRFEGALEKLMHDIRMYDRPDSLDLAGFEGSGADWLEAFKPYINDGESIVASPHKLFGPQTNDLVLQLRKRGINKVLLAGMSANLCTESHLRHLQEEGFEVAVAWDATGAAQLPNLDGMAAAKVNFRMLASEVFTTAEAVRRIRESAGSRSRDNVK